MIVGEEFWTNLRALEVRKIERVKREKGGGLSLPLSPTTTIPYAVHTFHELKGGFIFYVLHITYFAYCS